MRLLQQFEDDIEFWKEYAKMLEEELKLKNGLIVLLSENLSLENLSNSAFTRILTGIRTSGERIISILEKSRKKT